jgi:hypothetical protein
MRFYINIEGNVVRNIDDLKVSDKIICDDGELREIKNIVVISSYPTFIRFSNGMAYYIPERMKIKTTKGFKSPELWDVIEISKDLAPQIVNVRKLDRVMFFRDILVDGNMVTAEGLVFKYSD